MPRFSFNEDAIHFFQMFFIAVLIAVFGNLGVKFVYIVVTTVIDILEWLFG